MEASKRGLVLAGGWALVAIGVIMIPLPGPGILPLLAGLALLAPQVPWAKRCLEWIKSRVGVGAARDTP